MTRSQAVLGLDLGTGSVKAVAFTADRLQVLGQASAPLVVSAPRTGWAEADPMEWLSAAGRAVKECLATAGHPAPVGIGLSGQMHGVVLCLEDGTPTRPAVLWADTRSSDEVSRLKDAAPELRRRLANPLVTGMAATSLGWLVQHEPGAVQAARWALQPKDWLRLRFTGVPGTEPSDASATLLWDVPADGWCEAVFDLLDIPRRVAPPVRQSSAVAGSGSIAAPNGGGLIEPVPVVHGGADTACALFGTDPLPAGVAQISVGTGAQVVVSLGSPKVDPSSRTHLYRSVMPGSWYAMGAVQNAGLAFERAWRWLGIEWEQAYGLAEEAPAGADGLTFVPHISGERTPYVDPSIRGGWLGLGLEHGRSHLVRAVLEGVAFGIREAVEAVRAAGHPVERARLVGGGSRHHLWRRLLADVLGLPLIVVSTRDASPRGAARLACLGLGIEPDPASDEVEEIVEPAGGAEIEEAFVRFCRRSPIRGIP